MNLALRGDPLGETSTPHPPYALHTTQRPAPNGFSHPKGPKDRTEQVKFDTRKEIDTRPIRLTSDVSRERIIP